MGTPVPEVFFIAKLAFCIALLLFLVNTDYKILPLLIN